jgi:hypothetical protein
MWAVSCVCGCASVRVSARARVKWRAVAHWQIEPMVRPEWQGTIWGNQGTHWVGRVLVASFSNRNAFVSCVMIENLLRAETVVLVGLSHGCTACLTYAVQHTTYDVLPYQRRHRTTYDVRHAKHGTQQATINHTA